MKMVYTIRKKDVFISTYLLVLCARFVDSEQKEKVEHFELSLALNSFAQTLRCSWRLFHNVQLHFDRQELSKREIIPLREKSWEGQYVSQCRRGTFLFPAGKRRPTRGVFPKEDDSFSPRLRRVFSSFGI